MYRTKFNYLILTISISVLYFALISPDLLPNVTIPVKDALIISVFVILTHLSDRLINLIHTKQLEKKILLQYAQMKTIIDNISVSLYLKDLNGNVLLTNQNHSDMLNLKIKDIIGEKSDSFYKNLDNIKKEDDKVTAGRKIFRIERLLELKNGQKGWYRIVKAPVYNEDKEVENIVVLLYNIDDEKALEERKETFVATLTHDLKTPTIAQIKAIDLLLNQTFGTLNQTQIEFLEQIKNSCQYMYDLIFTVLDTYLYDNGQIKIHPEEFEINKLIDEAVSEVSNLLIEKEQNINIKRVIITLLSNAINYGNNKSNIELTLNEDENNIILNIKNKSNYISDDKILDLYEKFKRKDNIKFHKSGSGLGLYLAKQIIKEHNGDIFAKSNKDEQSCTFGFSLPKKSNFPAQTNQTKV